MEVRAKLSYARITPRKMRLVGDLVKGLPVETASSQLKFSQKRGSKLLSTLLTSAVANAKEKGGIDIEHLFIKTVMVDDGPMFKRFIPRAMGRATKVRKKMSHVTIILDEKR